MLAETDRYHADSDAVGRFIAEECLTGGAQSSSTTSQLYERWQYWDGRDAVELSLIAFGRALDSKGYPADQSAYRRPRRGICLKPGEEP